MANIEANAHITMTTATLDAATIQAIIDWVKTNIIDKLPANANVQIAYSITP